MIEEGRWEPEARALGAGGMVWAGEGMAYRGCVELLLRALWRKSRWANASACLSPKCSEVELHVISEAVPGSLTCLFPPLSLFTAF